MKTGYSINLLGSRNLSFRENLPQPLEHVSNAIMEGATGAPAAAAPPPTPAADKIITKINKRFEAASEGKYYREGLPTEVEGNWGGPDQASGALSGEWRKENAGLWTQNDVVKETHRPRLKATFENYNDRLGYPKVHDAWTRQKWGVGHHSTETLLFKSSAKKTHPLLDILCRNVNQNKSFLKDGAEEHLFKIKGPGGIVIPDIKDIEQKIGDVQKRAPLLWQDEIEWMEEIKKEKTDDTGIYINKDLINVFFIRRIQFDLRYQWNDKDKVYMDNKIATDKDNLNTSDFNGFSDIASSLAIGKINFMDQIYVMQKEIGYPDGFNPITKTQLFEDLPQDANIGLGFGINLKSDAAQGVGRYVAPGVDVAETGSESSGLGLSSNPKNVNTEHAEGGGGQGGGTGGSSNPITSLGFSKDDRMGGGWRTELMTKINIRNLTEIIPNKVLHINKVAKLRIELNDISSIFKFEEEVNFSHQYPIHYALILYRDLTLLYQLGMLVRVEPQEGGGPGGEGQKKKQKGESEKNEIKRTFHS